jgi:sensor histidine kinase YesM
MTAIIANLARLAFCKVRIVVSTKRDVGASITLINSDISFILSKRDVVIQTLSADSAYFQKQDSSLPLVTMSSTNSNAGTGNSETTGLIVGIVVGVVVLIAVLILVIVLLSRRHYAANKKRDVDIEMRPNPHHQ